MMPSFKISRHDATNSIIITLHLALSLICLCSPASVSLIGHSARKSFASYNDNNATASIEKPPAFPAIVRVTLATTTQILSEYYVQHESFP